MDSKHPLNNTKLLILSEQGQDMVLSPGDLREAQLGTLTGVSVGNFLQLIEMERTSCRLDLLGGNGAKGGFLFVEGVLYDAVQGDRRGEPAVIEMIGWEDSRITMKPLPENFQPKRRIHSPLMPLLMEGARSVDEHKDGMNGSPSDWDEEDTTPHMPGTFRDAETASPPGVGDDVDDDAKTGGTGVSGLKGVLKEMADEMDGVIAVCVAGVDGILVAEHNPTGADTDAFSAKFAMVMKLASKSLKDIRGMGDFEENLVQTKNAWVLTHYLDNQYYLGIVVSREGTLGNIRLVTRKYIEQLQRSL